LVLVPGPDHPHARVRADQLAQAPQVTGEGALATSRAPQRVGGDDPRRPGQARLQCPGEVYLAVKAAAQQPWAVLTPQLVTEYARPDERVDVKVDDLALAVDVHRLARHPQRSRPRLRLFPDRALRDRRPPVVPDTGG